METPISVGGTEGTMVAIYRDDPGVFEAKSRWGQVCVAEWSVAGVTAADFEGLRRFAAFQNDLASALPPGSGFGDDLSGVFELDGVPVRMRSLRDGKQASETIVVKINRRDLPPDAFAPPAGWIVKTPAPPGRLGQGK